MIKLKKDTVNSEQNEELAEKRKINFKTQRVVWGTMEGVLKTWVMC